MTSQRGPILPGVEERGRRPSLGAGILVLLGAIAAGLALRLAPWGDEGSVTASLGVLGLLAVATVGVFSWRSNRAADPFTWGLALLVGASAMLVSIYSYATSFLVEFPADILIWSESEFVNDIIKLRTGHPLYTDQAENESFFYTPGAPVLTYLIASVLGAATSIPTYRAIQLLYVAIATVVAFLIFRRLDQAHGGVSKAHAASWGAFGMCFLFLAATNRMTNPFSHLLHNDALSLLISAVAYGVLVGYAQDKRRGWIVVMAVLPGIGFLVKQTLAIWAPLYCMYLLFFDRPFSIRRVAVFAFAAFGIVGAAFALGYALWGDAYLYWMTALSEHPHSVLRAGFHLIEAWGYLAIGLIGAVALVRHPGDSTTGLWIVWLILFLSEGYTSGIAWMRNHLGPGSLIAAVWFAAGLSALWRWMAPFEKTVASSGARWCRTVGASCVVILLFRGLQQVRFPIRDLPPEAYGYIHRIEAEFAEMPTETVLLDFGSWMYLRENVVMKDRATSIGDRGYSGKGDFSGILRRLREERYGKILVRNLHSEDFWYDHSLWDRSSGIRTGLLENYHEVRRFQGLDLKPETLRPYGLYGFSDLSVLMPGPSSRTSQPAGE